MLYVSRKLIRPFTALFQHLNQPKTLSYMRYVHVLLTMSFTLLLFACRKEYTPDPVEPPGAPAKHVLLKDITIPHLPSPYYHFEYNTDSLPTKVDFGSGFTIYDILYHGDTISEMRNNIFVNHDT